MASSLSLKELKARLRALGVTDLTHCLEKADLIAELERAERQAESGSGQTGGSGQSTGDVGAGQTSTGGQTPGANQPTGAASAPGAPPNEPIIEVDGVPMPGASSVETTPNRGPQVRVSPPNISFTVHTPGFRIQHEQNRARRDPPTNTNPPVPPAASGATSGIPPAPARQEIPENVDRDELQQLLFYEEDAERMKTLKKSLLDEQWQKYEETVGCEGRDCPVCLMPVERTEDEFPPLVQTTNSGTVVAVYHNRCLAQHINFKSEAAQFPVTWPVPGGNDIATSSSSTPELTYDAVPPLTIRQALNRKEYERHDLAYQKFEELRAHGRRNIGRGRGGFGTSVSATAPGTGSTARTPEDEELPEGCRRCPSCTAVIMKADASAFPGLHGCDNMTCRCGAKFCFKCGAVFSVPGAPFTQACNCNPGHGFFAHEDVQNNYRGLFDGNLEGLLGNLGNLFGGQDGQHAGPFFFGYQGGNANRGNRNANGRNRNRNRNNSGNANAGDNDMEDNDDFLNEDAFDNAFDQHFDGHFDQHFEQHFEQDLGNLFGQIGNVINATLTATFPNQNQGMGQTHMNFMGQNQMNQASNNANADPGMGNNANTTPGTGNMNSGGSNTGTRSNANTSNDQAANTPTSRQPGNTLNNHQSTNTATNQQASSATGNANNPSSPTRRSTGNTNDSTANTNNQSYSARNSTGSAANATGNTNSHTGNNRNQNQTNRNQNNQNNRNQNTPFEQHFQQHFQQMGGLGQMMAGIMGAATGANGARGFNFNMGQNSGHPGQGFTFNNAGQGFGGGQAFNFPGGNHGFGGNQGFGGADMFGPSIDIDFDMDVVSGSDNSSPREHVIEEVE